jgi:hypothetical protein
VVDAGVHAAVAASVVVEEGPWYADRAEVREVDDQGVAVWTVAPLDPRDRAAGAVA